MREISNQAQVGEAGATAVAGRSSADLLFLRSLDAKIKELIEAGLISEPPAAPVASQSTAQPQPSTTSLPARQSLRVADAPSIDSTQTTRPLTSLELEACETSRWFVIELMRSSDQIDAARIPNLSIFEEYKLYSVAWQEQDQPMYALRLGFFSSEIGAGAVVRYLDSYFPAATSRRVSIAEHERFADKLNKPSSETGASGRRLAMGLVSAPTGPRGVPHYID